MSLAENDKNRLIDFYARPRFRRDDNAGRVRWWSSDGQQIRFQVLSLIGNLEGRSVLDVGSGLGDMYAFLRTFLDRVDYTGVDLVPEFVARAQVRYPEVPFLETDFSDLPEDRKYDYVLASGSLSFKVDGNEDFYEQFIAKMVRMARLGVGFNMLNRRFHADDETYAAYDPVHIAEICRKYSPRIQVVTGYLREDFTVFIYPRAWF